MTLLLRASWQLLRALLLLLLVLMSVVVFALFTEPGVRSAFGIAERVLPAGLFTVGEVSGSLAERLRLRQVYLAVGELRVAVDRAELHWQPSALFQREFNIVQLDMSAVEVHLPPPADEPEPPDPQPFALPKLPDIQLPIAVRLQHLGLYQVEIYPYAAEQAIRIDALELAAHSAGEPGLRLEYLRLRAPEGQADMAGTLVPLGDYPVNLELDWQFTALPQGRLSGTGTVSGAIAQWLELEQWVQLHATEPPMQLYATARIDTLTLSLQAQGEWHDLVWPLTGPADYASPQGRFEFSGTLEDYQFLLDAATGGAALPSGQWQFNGHGSSEALHQLELHAQTLDGIIRAQANARWLPQLRWQVNLQGQGLNPGVHWPDLPGSVDIVLSSDGALQEDQLNLSLDLQQLSGQLSGHALDAQLSALLSGQDLTLQRLQLRSGEARITASGHLSEDWDLDFQMEIPRLAYLLPESSGRIRSQGRLSGSRMQPQAELSIDIADFALAGQQISRLQGEVMLDSSGARASRVNLQAADLVLGGQAWHTLNLNGAGTPQQHEVVLELASANLGRLGLGMNGRREDERRWQGQLTRLNLADTLAGDWQLVQAVGLSAAADHARLAAPLCLSSQASRLCLSGQWDATAGGSTELVIERLDLARFTTLVTDTVEVQQTLSARVQAALDSQGEPSATVQLDLSPGRLAMELYGEPIALDLGASRLNSRLSNGQARNELRLDLGALGNINSTLEINTLFTQPQLNGRLLADLEQFALFSPFLPQIEAIQGRLQADLRIVGAWPNPDFNGAITLNEGGFIIPELGTQIENIELTARGNGQGVLLFSGQAHSGEGAIALEGRYQLGDSALNLTLRGENFTVLDTFSQVLITPDVTVLMDTTQILVTGEVGVPVANLAPPPQQRTRITASQDVVFVGRDIPEVEVSHRGVNARLRVVLGDEVWVEALGFRGQLRGDLLVEQTPELAPRGSGSLEVVSGDYTIYGQDLAIERGRLLFAGPLDTPGLDLRVSRNFEAGAVQVGAQVLGTLQQPQLDLFSTPAMSNSYIVSYLLFGRAPGGASGESQLLAQAAAALSARGGNFLTRDIAESLGVDIRFDAGNGLDDSAVTIGRYLAPGLYVSYGIGLFEAMNTFNLRYQINRYLTLESTSSAESSSADVLYTIER